MDGFKVVRIEEVLKFVDIVITATGNKGVFTREHAEKLKSGAILCNMGHSNTEIDVSTIQAPDIIWVRKIKPLKSSRFSCFLKPNLFIFRKRFD
jgi:adenosylhomocysteinase